MGITRVVDLARIAERVLAGEIAARRGQYEQAIEHAEGRGHAGRCVAVL